ncbi:MAG TPA: protein translocase subunit SecDF [Bacteroidia bacterium]|nr:protein translocase subunit SecDF [Bacteroidia bacterium]HRH07190.1 protein translocase subunit SecDF [Bacteroidia bacterium]
MQNKGAIKFFAIALAVVCIFQLSFTLITRNAEKRAAEYASSKFATMQNLSDAAKANPDSVKESISKHYLDSIAGLPLYNILLKNYTYRECKEKEINLGLDLRGGMNVTLEVSVVDLIKAMSKNSNDSAFNKALQVANQKMKNSQKDYVTLFAESYKEVAPNGKLAAIFNTIELKDKIKYESTNEEVVAVIRKEATDAIDRSEKILRTRIDKFGVTQPNIQKLGISGRILIELPGVKEKERVRKLLQGTANLEFWETYDNNEISPLLIKANEKLAALLHPELMKDTANADTTAEAKLNPVAETAAPDTTKATSESEGASLSSAKKDTNKLAAKNDTAKAKQENPLFEVLTPAVQRGEKGQFYAAPGPVIGTALIADTAKVNEMLAMQVVKGLLPQNLRPLWTVKAFDTEERRLQLVAIKSNRENRAPLEGNVITDASGDFAQNSSKAEVSMSMNSEGAQTWKRLTKENIGKSIAIVLDNSVYSFPTVQSEIGGGRSSITGNFDITEAKDLANILKAGKLPAPARIVQEAVVGPSLGKEAIVNGLFSFVIALVLVLLFMGFYYNKAGWVADIALFANVFFIMGILASLGAVLTLPGIAGIVLTIGMSVDANILIFERVREELHAGNSVKQAIKEGFHNAMSSVIDSNITTLLLGIILYVFGTGPIQGFATTLIIGILTSLFSAIFISRLIFENMLDKNRTISFSTKATENMFKNININFVGKRKLYYLISSAIIAMGIVGYTMHGLNFGVDFKGGRTYVVRFDGDTEPEKVREALAQPLAAAPEVKTFGKDNQVKITTPYLIDDNSTDVDAKVEAKINEGLSKLGKKYTIMSSQKVGENISDDIKISSVWAVVFSCILMFIFIFIRFRKWQYGLGAVAALFHDVLIVLSCYAIFNGVLPFSLEIDANFIAAILTVMAYSMTDTVVVFDRIREYLSTNNKKELIGKEQTTIINYALNSTLSRTINTSLTIFFVLLAIFVFGGEVIRGFAFALLIGIVIGTYSSICIATPIVIDFDKQKQE